MTLRLLAFAEAELVPWYGASDDLTAGWLRRCLTCGRLSDIVLNPGRATEPTEEAVALQVAHGADCPAHRVLVAIRSEPS